MEIRKILVTALFFVGLNAYGDSDLDYLNAACPSCYEAAEETAQEKGVTLNESNLKEILESDRFQEQLKPKTIKAYREFYCSFNECVKS